LATDIQVVVRDGDQHEGSDFKGMLLLNERKMEFEKKQLGGKWKIEIGKSKLENQKKRIK
jgi:hypothetical protein